MKFIYIVELRKGWLSQSVLSTFNTLEEADIYMKRWRKDNWKYLKSNPDTLLEISTARR